MQTDKVPAEDWLLPSQELGDRGDKKAYLVFKGTQFKETGKNLHVF